MLRFVSFQKSCTIHVNRGYAVRRSKDLLSLPFSSDYFGSRRGLNKNQSSEQIEPPNTEVKKAKTEETIHKLWAKKQAAETTQNKRIKIQLPQYTKIKYTDGNTSVVESDDEFGDKFADPFKSQRMGSISDEVISGGTNEESKTKILESLTNLTRKDDVDSEEFDAMLDFSTKKEDVADNDQVQTPETNEVQEGERESRKVDYGLKGIGEKKAYQPQKVDTSAASQDRVYTIEDLTRSDTLAPNISETFDDIVGDELKDADEEARYSFIEDIDLSTYSLQRGNIMGAQQFLQDVAKFKTSDFPMEKRTKIVDMIKKARRILDSHKASRNFWDEFIVFRQINELSDVAAIHFRPVLHPGVKDSIFLLHQSNPEEWTTGKLAQRFRIKKARVEAILLLKIDEHIKRKTKPWEVDMGGDDIDFLYGDYYGVVGHEWLGNDDDRFNINERRWRNARIGSIDDEVKKFFFLSFFFHFVLLIF